MAETKKNVLTKAGLDRLEKELEFSIVGSTEANSLQQKLSNESPLGMALLGHEVGDDVLVELADGEAKYKVLEIKKVL